MEEKPARREDDNTRQQEDERRDAKRSAAQKIEDETAQEDGGGRQEIGPVDRPIKDPRQGEKRRHCGIVGKAQRQHRKHGENESRESWNESNRGPFAAPHRYSSHCPSYRKTALALVMASSRVKPLRGCRRAMTLRHAA